MYKEVSEWVVALLQIVFVALLIYALWQFVRDDGWAEQYRQSVKEAYTRCVAAGEDREWCARHSEGQY